jgi:hypothetical protein
LGAPQLTANEVIYACIGTSDIESWYFFLKTKRAFYQRGTKIQFKEVPTVQATATGIRNLRTSTMQKTKDSQAACYNKNLPCHTRWKLQVKMSDKTFSTEAWEDQKMRIHFNVVNKKMLWTRAERQEMFKHIKKPY